MGKALIMCYLLVTGVNLVIIGHKMNNLVMAVIGGTAIGIYAMASWMRGVEEVDGE